MNQICVIVPMYGKHELTRKCVDFTLKNAGMPVDILVVDDGSPEPYKDDRVIHMRLPTNTGYTNATNQGILWAGDMYKYLHLLNNDTEPCEDFIKILFEEMEKDPVIGIAGSARILATHPGPHNLELFGADLIRGYQRMTSVDHELPSVIHTHWLPVCSALVRVSMLREIGILDKSMRTWCSDADLCFRANFAGWNVSLIPRSRVVHIHQGTTGNNISEGVSRDQKTALQKMSGFHYAKLMREFPLDCESKTYGKLTFEVEKR